tara:strand:- start:2755 stop:2877 length:123 start_codon:yes stop_codon:yes gene_type:complete
MPTKVYGLQHRREVDVFNTYRKEGNMYVMGAKLKIALRIK